MMDLSNDKILAAVSCIMAVKALKTRAKEVYGYGKSPNIPM